LIRLHGSIPKTFGHGRGENSSTLFCLHKLRAVQTWVLGHRPAAVRLLAAAVKLPQQRQVPALFYPSIMFVPPRSPSSNQTSVPFAFLDDFVK
jgi:hypothetical protein